MTMNIICNNCVGARLYEIAKTRFPNPFMWNYIDPFDFISLINNFESYDLSSAKFSLENYKTNTDKSVLCTIEDIKLHFIHHIQNDSYDTPVKDNNINILYKDILTYVKTKWDIRYKRMQDEPIHFLFVFNSINTGDNKYYEVLTKLFKTKKPLTIVIHENVTINECIPSNIQLIRCSNEVMESTTGKIASTILPYLNFDTKITD